MLNHGYVQATSHTAMHRARKSPGMPRSGGQQDLRGFPCMVRRDRRYGLGRALHAFDSNQGNVGHLIHSSSDA
jgi:hypothetical protein